jgi:hypothetical protein
MIRDIATLANYVNVATNAAFEKLKPYIDEAALIVADQISPAQYNALANAYNSEPSEAGLSATDSAAINLIRPALANHAMALALPRLQFAIGTNGTLIISNETQKTAFPWQIEAAKNGYLAAADSHTDNLLAFLEANKNTYTLWASSEAYTEFKNCLVFNTAQFHAVRPIANSRRLFRQLKPHMLFVQDLEVSNTIGADYLAELLTQSASNSLTADNKLVVDSLRKAIINKAAAAGLLEGTLVADNEGLRINTSRSTEIPTGKETPDHRFDKRLNMLAQAYTNTGDSYLKSALDFLNTYASSSRYTTFFNSVKYVAPGTSTGFTNSSEWGIVGI